MIVVDAMNLGYLFLNHPSFSEDVRAIAHVDHEWCAPPLWRSELRNIFMQHVRTSDPDLPGSELTLSGAVKRMQAAEDLIGSRTFEAHSERVLRLSQESGCTPYDCEYVALARRLDVPLVTYDGEILDAFPNTALSPTDVLAANDD